MVNFSKLAMLHHGAHIQTGQRLNTIEEDFMRELDAKESRIAALESQIKGLLN